MIAKEILAKSTTLVPMANSYYNEEEYDDQGNKIKERYLGVNGLPIQQSEGYSEKTIRYDSRGNPIEWKYLDTKGELTKNQKGYARALAKYNKYNERVGIAYFSTTSNYIGGDGELKRQTPRKGQ